MATFAFSIMHEDIQALQEELGEMQIKEAELTVRIKELERQLDVVRTVLTDRLTIQQPRQGPP